MADFPGPDPVVVIGAGIVGLSSALAIQREGLSVLLVDRGQPGHGASFGHAGGIAVTWVSPQGLPDLVRRLPRWLLDPLGPVAVRWPYLPRLLPWFLELRRHSSPTEVRRLGDALASLMSQAWPSWESLLARLGGESARLVKHEGSLTVYHGRRQLDHDRLVWDMRRVRGFQVETVDEDALRTHEPALSADFTVGVLERQAKWCEDPMAVVDSMAASFVSGGGLIVRTEVVGFDEESSTVRGVRTTQGVLPSSAVVIAAGAWSHRVAAHLGHTLPLESERGYHVDIPDPGVRLRRILSLAPYKVVVTPLRGGVRLSGTAEFGGVDSLPDFRRADALVTVARRALPDLVVGEHKQWAGDRPILPDSLPTIGWDPHFGNVCHAYGHSHIGFTLGPLTGDLVADLLARRTPRVDLTPFRAARFG
ncbi:MAG TPA: FAD-binding oxidoreductase [Acidimicrobiia bacterium]|nr:FAD-binding oxidoreductase [Acidimicrobiia bacterium]